MNGPNARAPSRSLDVIGNNSDTPSPLLGFDRSVRHFRLGYLGGRLLLGLLVANLALMAGCLATATLPPAQEEVSADWTEADERGLGADERGLGEDETASAGDNER